MDNLDFTLVPGRTTRQGQQINVGKDRPEYLEIVGTVLMNPADVSRLRLADNARVRLRSAHGDAVFRCRSDANVPEGLLFVPYGPPTSRLMSGETEGTGMPVSKGLRVSVERVSDQEEEARA
ncbi:MAG: molybdopterin dinucleotide binding domain-containing protein [Armatimonadota bacterium]|nr:molybdopterin dinucleotide binding domain-containing protein [Armatimonadota bacterium]